MVKIKQEPLLPDDSPMDVRCFPIVGDARPQGDKSAVQTARGFRVIEGNNTESRNKHKTWRGAVADAVARHLDGHDPLLDKPLWMRVCFRYHMPASRPAYDRKRGWSWKVSAPDFDKLARALGDGLVQGGLIKDDSRIVDAHILKIEVVPPAWTGCTLVIGTHEEWSYNLARFALDEQRPPSMMIDPEGDLREHVIGKGVKPGVYFSRKDGVLHARS